MGKKWTSVQGKLWGCKKNAYCWCYILYEMQFFAILIIIIDRVPTVMEKSWKMTGHGKVMEKSWKIIGHGKVMEFSRSWKKSWKTQIWTNLFCRFCRTSCLWNTDLTTLLTKVFTMKDTESTLCKSRTYFEIVTMAKVCPGRVWWLLQHFSYILHFKRVK